MMKVILVGRNGDNFFKINLSDKTSIYASPKKKKKKSYREIYARLLTIKIAIPVIRNEARMLKMNTMKSMICNFYEVNYNTVM